MSMTEDTAKYLVFHPVGVIHLYPQEASPRRPIRRYQKTLPRQTSGLLPGHYPPCWKAPHAPVEICLPHKDMAKTWHKASLHLRARLTDLSYSLHPALVQGVHTQSWLVVCMLTEPKREGSTTKTLIRVYQSKFLPTGKSTLHPQHGIQSPITRKDQPPACTLNGFLSMSTSSLTHSAVADHPTVTHFPLRSWVLVKNHMHTKGFKHSQFVSQI